MIQQVKRPRFLFFFVEERPQFDVQAFLAGELRADRLPQVFALAPLTESKCPLTPDELTLLSRLPAESWTPAGELDVEATRLEELARSGVLLTDAADPELALLRERDDLLARRQWHPYAAFYHFMNRESEAKSLAAKLPDTEHLAATLADDTRRFVAEHGPPPDPFLSLADAGAATEVVGLPRVERSGELFEVLDRRRTVRAFDTSRPMELADAATLLDKVYGCQGVARFTPEVLALHKTSPSGGSLHPIEAYPLVIDVRGLDPGIYHYDVRRHALERIRAMDREEARSFAAEIACDQSYVASAHLVVMMTARFYRTYWKYRLRSRAYAVILMDAAHLSQTFYLVAARLELGAFFTAAVNAGRIEEMLGVDPGEEGAIALCGAGLRVADGPDLGLDFEPYRPDDAEP